MAETTRTLGEHLQRLRDLGHLTTEQIDRIGTRRRAIQQATNTPIYLHLFVFAGALLAAAMITVGGAEMLDVRWTGTSLLLLGTVYLATAVALHRRAHGPFFEYLALSLSIGGHGFALAGVAELADSHRSLAIFATSLLLCVALYPLYRAFLHRVGSCLLVFVIAKLVLPQEDLGDVLHGFVAFMAGAAAWLLTRPWGSPARQPIAIACVIGLFVHLLPISDRGLWFEDVELPHRWISSATMGVALLWGLHWAARSEGVRPTPAQALLAIAVVAGLSSLATPGIPAALFVLVLGHATYHRSTAATGLAALPLFLWKYYYSLDLELLAKSGVLVASGALLLFARWALLQNRWMLPPREPNP